jgi:hypothetical protein
VRRKGMKIYISGPVTGTNDSKEWFEAAERELKEAGRGPGTVGLCEVEVNM